MRSAPPSGSSSARSWAGTSPLRDAATGTLRMSQESQCKNWRTEPMQHDGEAVRCIGTSAKTSSESSQVAPMMEFSSAITALCIVYNAILHGNVSRVIDSHLLHEPVTLPCRNSVHHPHGQNTWTRRSAHICMYVFMSIQSMLLAHVCPIRMRKPCVDDTVDTSAIGPIQLMAVVVCSSNFCGHL